MASLEGGTVRLTPSTRMTIELLPSVIWKRRARYVRVLSPAESSSPGMSLRPPSPTRHTYTRARGSSDRYTYAGGVAADAELDAAEPAAAELFAFDLCVAGDRVEAVFLWLFELEPPLTSP